MVHRRSCAVGWRWIWAMVATISCPLDKNSVLFFPSSWFKVLLKTDLLHPTL